MQKQTIVSMILGGLLLSVLVFLVPSQRTQAFQVTPVRSLVISDLGAYEEIVNRMEGNGWEVTIARTLEIELGNVEALADYDVVWLSADANYPALRHLVKPGSQLDSFTRQGGVVVIWNLNPNTMWLDIAPGGADVEPLPEGGAVPVVITAADHPLITGEGIGGTPLTFIDLDPTFVGGGGCVLNVPENLISVSIAENTLAPVIVHYTHGQGHVVIGALIDELPACRENVLLFVQSISQ